MAYQDLREFIRALEKNNELKRIPFEVDPRLEITEFADRAGRPGVVGARQQPAHVGLVDRSSVEGRADIAEEVVILHTGYI